MPDKSSDRERRIRERAYFIWLAAGRPHGAALLHWHQAEAVEDGGGGDFEADEANRGKDAGSVPWSYRGKSHGLRR